MDNVNKTLYIPLYGKALVSRRGIILDDPWAEKLWAGAAFPLKGKSKSGWLACYMGMRAAVFDRWVARQLREWEEAAVLHLGCGLDSRAQRVAAEVEWYDVDFPAVIRERRRYFQETAHYHMIGSDVRDPAWLEAVGGKTAVVVMEGISMYLTAEELKNVMENITRHFEQVRLLMDCYTVLAARASRYKNPINDVGVTRVYGLDDPKLLEEGTGLAFRAEHDMTPAELTAQLEGLERGIFRKLYAGSLSRKLYRLYEYRKNEK